MGLLSEAKDFVNDTFQASSPPPPLKKLKSQKGTNVSILDDAKNLLSSSKTTGSMNPYMVWIQGHDSIGTIGIDGILKGPFEIPIAANWAPVLPQFAQDIAGVVTGSVAGLANAASRATSGSSIGAATAVGAGIANGANSLVSGGGIGAINGALSGLTGESLTNPSWYQLIWQSNQPLAFTIDMDFFTLEDPDKDVIDPVAQLQKFILPTFQNGSMRAPGYHPINGWAGIGEAISSGGQSGFGHLSNRFGDSSYKLDVHIGNTCRFNNVVIAAVNAHYNTMPSVKNKKFHTVSCAVTFAAQEVLVKDNIDQIYKRKPYSYDANDPITSTEQQFSDLKNRAFGAGEQAIGNAANSVSNAASSVGNFLSGVTHVGGF